jgi:hypothetical protein
MADKKPIVQYSGQLTQILDADVCIVNGGIDTSGATPLVIGATNATAIDIGQPGVTTTIKGDLGVDGDEIVVGTTTFQGDTQIGDATTDTLAIVASIEGGPLLGPNAPILPVTDSAGLRPVTFGSSTLRLADINSAQFTARADATDATKVTITGQYVTFLQPASHGQFTVGAAIPNAGVVGHDVYLTAGQANAGGNAAGGRALVAGGAGGGTGAGGEADLYGGAGGATNGNGGFVRISGGVGGGAGGNGGDVEIDGGTGAAAGTIYFGKTAAAGVQIGAFGGPVQTKSYGHVVPGVDITYDLGENTTPLRWRNVYAQNFVGGITPSGNLNPAADNTYDMGQLTLRWKTLYLGPASLKVFQDPNTTGLASEDYKVSLGYSGGGSNAQLLFTSAAGGQSFTVTSPTPTTLNAGGNDVQITGGPANGTGLGGLVAVDGGSSPSGTGGGVTGGSTYVRGGNGSSAGGICYITGGSATNGNGADVEIKGGLKGGVGVSNGNVTIGISSTDEIHLGQSGSPQTVLFRPYVSYFGPLVGGSYVAVGCRAEYNHLIGVYPSATANTAGGNLNVTAGNATGTAAGGNLSLAAGTGGSTSGDGGDVTVQAGTGGAPNGNGGDVYLRGGSLTGTGVDGTVYIGDSSTAGLQIGAAGGGANDCDTSSYGDINPGTDDTYDLGTSTLRWKNVNVGTGSVYVRANTTTDYSQYKSDGVTFARSAGGGTFTIDASPPSAGNGHGIQISGGLPAFAGGTGGPVGILGGAGSGGNPGGYLLFQAGSGGASGIGGDATLQAGSGGTGAGNGGATYVNGGNASAGTGGNLFLRGGNGAVASGIVYVGDNNTDSVHLGAGGATTPVIFDGYVQSDILPSADDTYDLGSPALRWAEGHFGPGSVYVRNSTTVFTKFGYNEITYTDPTGGAVFTMKPATSTTGNGHTTSINGGNAGGANNNGGSLDLLAGDGGASNGGGGQVNIGGGSANGLGTGGPVNIGGGSTTGTQGGGGVAITGGQSGGSTIGASVSVTGGIGGATGAGGHVTIRGGAAGGGNTNGGNVYVRGGLLAGGGVNGNVYIGDLNTNVVYIGFGGTTTTVEFPGYIGTHFIPKTDATYNLGENVTPLRWNNVYAVNFVGGISPSGDLVPAADNTYDLGTLALRWKTLYLGPASLKVFQDPNTTGSASEDYKVSLGYPGGGSDAQLLFTSAAGGQTLGITSATPTTANATGNAISVLSSAGNGTGAGGDLTLQSGTGGATNGNGGVLYLYGGTAVGTGTPGDTYVFGGFASLLSSVKGGTLTLQGGRGGSGGNGGDVYVQGGNNNGDTQTGGDVYVLGGDCATDGQVYIATSHTSTLNLPDANDSVSTVIGGIAQGATYTGENLKKLHDNSDATGLHYHSSGGGGSYTDVDATAKEVLVVGQPVLFYNDAGTAKVRLSDANASGRQDCVGLVSLAASGDGQPTKIRVAGEAQTTIGAGTYWDTDPAAGDVGKKVYISLTQGKLTYDVSGFTTTGDYILRVGWISRVDAPNNKAYVVLGIGEGVTV